LSRAVARAAATRAARTTPSTPRAAAGTLGDGITLLAPPNGGTVPPGAAVTFSWTQTWFCPDCEIAIAIVVATDPQFNNPVVGSATGCAQSTAPSCPTSVTVPGFAAGTYYWVIGVKLGDAVHVSDVWSFTAGAPTPTAPTKPGSLSFTDAPGDANGAPDITGVAVSNDANGQILMQINTPGSSDIATDEAVVIFLDTDQNPATGEPDALGMEYVIVFDGEARAYFVAHWNGTDFVDVPAPTSSARYSGGAQVSINRSDLGGLSGFNFWVRVVKGTGASAPFDDAPDRGTWSYTLGAGAAPPATPTAPATPPATPKKATVASIKVLALPAAPTAGLQFRILVPSVKLSTGQDVRPTTARCSAKLAGKTLAGRGVGRCTFTMPRGSGGSSLSVTITVTYRGATKARTMTFRVRRP
jgi:hypothetical protein